MAKLLIVDDSVGLIAPLVESIRQRTTHEVGTVADPADVGAAIDEHGPIDLALVDLSFPYDRSPHDRGSGLDALVAIHDRSPSTHLVIYSQADHSVAPLLRDAWELLPVKTVIGKSTSLEALVDTIEQVLTSGTAPVDPAVQLHLPARRPRERTPASFARLVPHAGHAKLWNALMSTETAATYKQIADHTGLKLNTIKNYRANLLPELRLHGLDQPSLDDIRDFALRCRPFLTPYIDEALQRGS